MQNKSSFKKAPTKMKRFISNEEKDKYTDHESDKIKLISRRVEVVKTQG